MRKQVKSLLRDGLEDTKLAEVAELLGHPDRRIRHLAQSEMVRRRQGLELIRIANEKSAEQLARIHALWGLIQLRDSGHRRWLAGRLPWRDPDPQIRQQCARVAGDLKLIRSGVELVKLLSDEAPLVQSHAAIALGKVGSVSETERLFELLKRNADSDPFIRHAAVFGLSGSASEDQLAAKRDDPDAAVRMGAVLALRKQKSAQIIAFLEDKDVRVLREAIRGIHDDFSIPGALAAVAALLDNEEVPRDEPILRRIISANLRVGDLAAAHRLVNFVTRETSDSESSGKLEESLKLEALQSIARWQQSPLVDRVEGRIRKSKRAEPKAAGIAMSSNLTRILATNNDVVGSMAIQCATELGVEIDSRLKRGWIATQAISMGTRVSLLRSHAMERDPAVRLLVEEILNQRLATSDTELWRAAFELLVERDPDAAWERVDLTTKSLSLKQFFIRQLPRFGTEQADAALADLVGDASSESNGDSRLALDVLHAAKARGLTSEDFKLLEQRIASSDYGEFSFAIEGGDALRGEAIYRNHVSAQCIRCHNAGGKGKQAGPELDAIGLKERAYLLEALVDPGKTIAKGFEGVTIVKDNGKLITGTIISEDDQQIIVGNVNGKRTVVRKSEIDDRSAASQSAMPKMTEVLTPLEVRDVVEYLSTLKTTP